MANVQLKQGDTTDGAEANIIDSRLLTSNTPLVPRDHDYVELLPAGSATPTTINFKTGGSGGTTVVTLTLTYSGGELATVTKS